MASFATVPSDREMKTTLLPDFDKLRLRMIRMLSTSDPLRVTKALIDNNFLQNDALPTILGHTAREDQTIYLVEAVINEIKKAPSKFAEFLEALSELPWTKHTGIVEDLHSTYHKSTMPPESSSVVSSGRVESDFAFDQKVLNPAQTHGYISKDALEALQRANQLMDTYQETKANLRPRCTIFYMRQSLQELGNENDRFDVPVYIDLKERFEQWLPHINKAIVAINQAAPGLQLHKVSDMDSAKIRISGTSFGQPRTDTDILSNSYATIFLCDKWPNMERSSVHELIHALGFKHEHDRRDRDRYIDVRSSSSNCNPSNDILGATRFDPFSIMLYSEKNYVRKPQNDTVWNLKESTSTNKKMSELDKVGLNLLYRPCKGKEYDPQVSKITGMWYCGRKVMEDHNHPDKRIITNGCCGPMISANCHACRTLKNEKIKDLWDDGKWQGWSGLFYCGKNYNGHLCGPDNGTPCRECKEILAVP